MLSYDIVLDIIQTISCVFTVAIYWCADEGHLPLICIISELFIATDIQDNRKLKKSST